MKSLFRGALIASLLATPALANEPSTDLEKLSYSLGIILGERIQNDFGDLDPNFVLEGLKDSKDPNSWKLDRPAINQAVQDAQTRIRAQQEQQVEAMAEANLKSGEAFLAENAKKDGVTAFYSKRNIVRSLPDEKTSVGKSHGAKVPQKVVPNQKSLMHGRTLLQPDTFENLTPEKGASPPSATSITVPEPIGKSHGTKTTQKVVPDQELLMPG